MQTAELQIEVVPPDGPEARWCLEAYFRELAARFEDGFDPTRACHAGAHPFAAPHGAFLVARLGERLVGCGALRVIDERTGEVKRLWVAPEARRHGVARRILGELEAMARQRGLATLRLDTNRARPRRTRSTAG
jgi:GNAT superfamily N-acetyltransferase